MIPQALYDGHNKTFFFGSYEGLLDTYEPAGGYSAFVPTDAMAGRNGLPGGDFSYGSNKTNYPILQIGAPAYPGSASNATSSSAIYDPTNIVGSSRQIFAGNGSAATCAAAVTAKTGAVAGLLQ